MRLIIGEVMNGTGTGNGSTTKRYYMPISGICQIHRLCVIVRQMVQIHAK